MGEIRFRLGDFEFEGWEVPESLPIQFAQLLAIHEFPGGIKTGQSFGVVPERISWSGEFEGPDAFDRATQLQAIEQEIVILEYGPWNLEGLVKQVTATPKHRWQIPYTVDFEPLRANNALIANAGTLQPQPPSSTTPTQQLQNSTQQAAQRATDPRLSNQPATPAPSTSAGGQASSSGSGQTQTGGSGTTGSSGGSTPQTIGPLVQSLQSSIQTAVRSAAGNVQRMPSNTRQSLIAQIESAQQSLVSAKASADSSVSAAAHDLHTSLESMKIALSARAPLFVELIVVNPNLQVLASQWYGDPSKWTVIAQENKVIDSKLTGTWKLRIPVVSAAVKLKKKQQRTSA